MLAFMKNVRAHISLSNAFSLNINGVVRSQYAYNPRQLPCFEKKL